jgi:hypothetical protein
MLAGANVSHFEHHDVRRKKSSKMSNTHHTSYQSIKSAVPEDNAKSNIPKPFCISICPRNCPSFFSYKTVLYCETEGYYDIETGGVYRVYSTRGRKGKRKQSVIPQWSSNTPFSYVRVWPAKSTCLVKEAGTGDLFLVFINSKGVTMKARVAENVCDIILATKVRSRPVLIQEGEERTFVSSQPLSTTTSPDATADDEAKFTHVIEQFDKLAVRHQ